MVVFVMMILLYLTPAKKVVLFLLYARVVPFVQQVLQVPVKKKKDSYFAVPLRESSQKKSVVSNIT